MKERAIEKLTKRIYLVAGKKEFEDFDKWLKEYTTSEKFIEVCNKFIAIRKQLKNETDKETKEKLNRQEQNLVYEL
jgi:hypothetical protein